MDLAFYLYTFALIFIAVMAGTLSMAIWVMTKRRECIATMASFLCYALDLGVILFDEYSGTKISGAGMFEVPLAHPFATVLLNCGIIFGIWAYVRLRVGDRLTVPSVLGPAAAYFAACFALAFRSGEHTASSQYLFWLLIGLGYLSALIYAAHRAKATESDGIRQSLQQSRRFFLVVLALVVCMMMEDFLIILVVPLESSYELVSRLIWHLAERNISRDALMIVCFVQMLRQNQKILLTYASAQTGVPELSRQGEGPLTADEIVSRSIMVAERFGLSDREREVFTLAIMGLGNQEIANRLFISASTVKTHFSRIYSKLGITGRNELANAFWKYSG